MTWWNFPKKAWLIIIGELGVITSLSTWLYSTYLNDIYFQTYANGLSPILVPVLSVAFGVTSASIATYLYLGMKRIQISRETESPIKKRVARKSPKREQASSLQPKPADLLSSVPAKLKPIAPPQTHVHTQKSHLREQGESGSTRE